MACAVLLAGLPPLAGFVGKFAMLSALFAPTSVAPTSIAAAASVDAGIGWVAWTFAVLLIGSGFMTLVALSRTGIRHFWGPNTATLPTLPLLEVLPVGALLLAAALLTIGAEPVLRQTQAAADALLSGERYRRAVFNARPRVRAPRADTATTMKAP